jgi:hypothetical protein
MGKGHFRAAVLFGPAASKARSRCIACTRPIVYGDRCQDCRDKLRQRKHRKPR